MIAPETGILLIADPFLKDPHFQRSVVFLCDHQQEGSFGFVINRAFGQGMEDLSEAFTGLRVPVYYGGPVQTDTIHFLHQYPQIIPGGTEVIPGVYWGGDFNQAAALIRASAVDVRKLRFFIGYSGWGSGQLMEELNEKTWLTVAATRTLLFETPDERIWPDSLRYMGGEFQALANYPIDPQLN